MCYHQRENKQNRYKLLNRLASSFILQHLLWMRKTITHVSTSSWVAPKLLMSLWICLSNAIFKMLLLQHSVAIMSLISSVVVSQCATDCSALNMTNDVVEVRRQHISPCSLIYYRDHNHAAIKRSSGHTGNSFSWRAADQSVPEPEREMHINSSFHTAAEGKDLRLTFNDFLNTFIFELQFQYLQSLDMVNYIHLLWMFCYFQLLSIFNYFQLLSTAFNFYLLKSFNYFQFVMTFNFEFPNSSIISIF